MPNYPSRRADGGKPTVAAPMFIFLIDGVPVGRASRLTVDEDLGSVPVQEVGEPGPLEYVNTAYRCTLTVSSFRILGKKLRDAGLRINKEEVLTCGALDIQVVTREDPPRVLETYTHCTLARGSIDFSANAIVGQNAVFNVVARIEPEA
jgi:hypothetical protein